MLIYPITSANNRINKTTFQSKNIDVERIFNSQKIKEELSKIKTNKDARNIFLSLSVLAGSILAELTNLTDKTPDIKNFADKILNNLGFKDNEKLHKEMTELLSSALNDEKEEKLEDYSPLIEQNPQRAQYLSVLSDYPRLHEQYEQMLAKAVKYPDDAENKFTLDVLEVAFELMTKDNRFQYYESYFDTLENDYSDKLDDLASTLVNAYKNNVEPLAYLQKLNSGRIAANEVIKWANAKNLNFEEFLKCKFMDGEILTNISNLKGNNNNFTITNMRPFDNYKVPLYTFKLSFKDQLPLEQKLKTIADVHTAIYGPIGLNDDSDERYINSDIRTELADNLLKDRMIDAVYSFVKYINPDALKNIGLSSDDVRYLTKDDEIYKQIKSICSKEIMNLDTENPRFLELYSIMQNKEIFGDIITTTHSKLRFITRFVLKNNSDTQSLSDKCISEINILKRELDTNLQNFNILGFVNKKGYAPQFYNHNSELGNFVKITLNSSGTIHTIYEDINREVKDKKTPEVE